MCGLYGALGTWHAPEQGLHAIRRRGPDASAVWKDESRKIWFGHRRLSIQDLSSAGDQPMHSPDGRFVMIYNGEIYNAVELRTELETKGETFAGHCDSEVLLRLFQRDGVRAFARLNGIFAAVFWDRRDEVLTLVRDPMGVKPLYFHDGPQGLYFASEIKALVRARDIVAKPSPAGVLRHLGLLWSPGSQTIVEGVEKLLPGEVIEYAGGQIASRTRFADPPLPAAQVREVRDIAALADEVRDAVETAVKRQLLSDVPVGCFLSGGLDSSAITAFAARHHQGPGKLQCFTMEMADGASGGEGFADDLPYARRVAEFLDVGLHVVRADTSMMDRLAEMIWFLDEPTADFAALNTLLIAELGRANGFPVMLSGSGGDDIFSGYRRHIAVLQEKKWAWLPQAARRQLANATGLLPKNRALPRRIAKAFQHAGLPADERLASYFFWLAPDTALNLLNPEFAAGLTPDAMAAPMLKTLADVPAGTTALQQMLYLETKHFLTDHNLNYADKMGMAASVEIRVPLLDLDLVRLAVSLPDSVRVRGMTAKWIFKKAMEGILPNDVIYRPKTGFGVPLRQWLSGPLRGAVDQYLSPERLRDRGVFNPEAVARLMRDNHQGTIDASYSIFAVLCIEIWFQQFVDGAAAVE